MIRNLESLSCEAEQWCVNRVDLAEKRRLSTSICFKYRLRYRRERALQSLFHRLCTLTGYLSYSPVFWWLLAPSGARMRRFSAPCCCRAANVAAFDPRMLRIV